MLTLEQESERRFAAAVACLQGMLADPNARADKINIGDYAELVAQEAVIFADALLKELES